MVEYGGYIWLNVGVHRMESGLIVDGLKGPLQMGARRDPRFLVGILGYIWSNTRSNIWLN